MRKRKSSYMRALAARQEAARQQPAPEEPGEREPEAESPLTRFLLPSRKRRPYWR